MSEQTFLRRIPWLPTLLILWNLFDIAVHIIPNMAEPWRIAGNIISISAALIVLLGVAKPYAAQLVAAAATLVLAVDVMHSVLNGWLAPSFIFIGVSLILLLLLVQSQYREIRADNPIYLRWWTALAATVVSIVLVALVGEQRELEIGPLTQLHDGQLVSADYWRDEPLILSAGMGFDGIVGLDELTEESVRAVGGSWYGSLTCTSGEEPTTGNRTSAAPTTAITATYKGFANADDGLPIVFSWPVATETVDVTDFQFTLNTGEVMFANAAGMVPNWELNERNTVVLFADFGNRLPSSDPDARFPVKLEIVADDTPLLLIGPGSQEFNAVGLTWETDQSPYDSGPKLVGAKLNAVGDSAEGEGGVGLMESRGGATPNDEFALYDEGDFRIRVLTTGGFSPDGVTGIRPDMYEDFFRIHVNGLDGVTVLLEEVGQTYDVAGGILRVVGLSELGLEENPNDGIYYDDCYVEDRDNYIDIILVGDEAAARNITFVEIPSLEGGYSVFYNPGGPGPEPFEGVRYTAPGPPDMEPVIIALDDPMRVDRAAR